MGDVISARCSLIHEPRRRSLICARSRVSGSGIRLDAPRGGEPLALSRNSCRRRCPCTSCTRRSFYPCADSSRARVSADFPVMRINVWSRDLLKIGDKLEILWYLRRIIYSF